MLNIIVYNASQEMNYLLFNYSVFRINSIVIYFGITENNQKKNNTYGRRDFAFSHRSLECRRHSNSDADFVPRIGSWHCQTLRTLLVPPDYEAFVSQIPTLIRKPMKQKNPVKAFIAETALLLFVGVLICGIFVFIFFDFVIDICQKEVKQLFTRKKTNV